MKLFNRREALAHGNRVCLGVFPDHRDGKVTFVRIEQEDDGQTDFSVDHWTYGDATPAEWSDTEKFVRQALEYVRNCGATSVVLMYDPYSGEGLVQRLLDDPDWSGFIDRTVQLTMTRTHMARAHEVVAQALEENRVTKFEGQDHGVALAVEAAIQSVDAPPRWIVTAKRWAPITAVLTAALVNAIAIPDDVSVGRAIVGVNAGFLAGYFVRWALDHGWRS